MFLPVLTDKVSHVLSIAPPTPEDIFGLCECLSDSGVGLAVRRPFVPLISLRTLLFGHFFPTLQLNP